MTHINKIMKFLQDESKKGNIDIDLNQFFNVSKLKDSKFDELLQDLQKRDLIEYKQDIKIPLNATHYSVNIFNRVYAYFYTAKFVYNFEAKLTPQGINYPITE